jgi:small subunit ribosomal protein S6
MANRIYEVMIAFDTSVQVGDADILIEKLKGIVTAGKGTVRAADKIGYRKLAFKVKGRTECNMALLTCEMPSEVVPQLEQVLKLHEGVLRYMTTRVDPKLVVPHAAAPVTAPVQAPAAAPLATPPPATT